MFHDITSRYDGTDATFEILIMLVLAFLLGMLVHWAFTDEGDCCEGHDHADAVKEKAEKVVKKTTAPVKKTVAKTVKSVKDNLRLIDGIGPKIEKLLNDDGIKSFEDLATAKKNTLDAILEKAGPRFQMHDPATWAAQAKKLMKK
jgi:predicted flap endonuclease-1-like 5' DNA nuclease